MPSPGKIISSSALVSGYITVVNISLTFQGKRADESLLHVCFLIFFLCLPLTAAIIKAMEEVEYKIKEMSEPDQEDTDEHM